MAVLGKDYQPIVKNVDGVLAGVAQVRLGKSSYRRVGTAAVGTPAAASKSEIIIDESDGVTPVVAPISGLPSDVVNTWAGQPVTVIGTYTGRYDGCFIVRAGAYNDTLGEVLAATGKVEVFAPNGFRTQLTLVAGAVAATEIDLNDEVSATTSGLSFALNFGASPTTQVGDTWVVPVWSGVAIDRTQTCIVTPFSMFRGANESVGGLTDAAFTPNIEAIAQLESGFPAVVMDRIVTKTSGQITFDAQEFINERIQIIKDMVSQIINKAKLSACPVEVVMRSRGNVQVSFWIPNAGITKGPTYNPKNDYSTFPWEMEAINQTEVSKNGDFADLPSSGDPASPKEYETFQAWLRNIPLYSELYYKH